MNKKLRLIKKTKLRMIEDLVDEKASQIVGIDNDLDTLDIEIDEVKSNAVRADEIIGGWGDETSEVLLEIKKERRVLKENKSIIQEEIIELYEIMDLLKRIGEKE